MFGVPKIDLFINVNFIDFSIVKTETKFKAAFGCFR